MSALNQNPLLLTGPHFGEHVRLTMLRGVSFANKAKLGQAFFSLSIGLERLGKLIFILSYQQKNNAYPTNEDLREFGHDLKKILEASDEIKTQAPIQEEPYNYIVRILNDFSKKSRYYNLDSLTNASDVPSSPFEEWDSKIHQYVIERHFNPHSLRSQQWEALKPLLEENSAFLYKNFDGSIIRTHEDYIESLKRMETIQKYSTFYVAILVREISKTIRSFDPYGSLLSEFYICFQHTDSDLKRKKRWDPSRP